MKSVFTRKFKLSSKNFDFEYQKGLTKRLDSYEGSFNQSKVNEIVLWKLNRYALIDRAILKKLNSLKRTDTIMNKSLTKEILEGLLKTKGIQLPVASTILRFRNPKIYQILDQRVFRILYGKELKIVYYETQMKQQNEIDLYLKYLVDLGNACKKLDIAFELSDRILYMADRRMNKGLTLRNY